MDVVGCRRAPDDRAASGDELGDRAAQALDPSGVEARRGLVEQDEPRLVEERHRQPQPLPLSRRQPVGAFRREPVEPEESEGALDPFAPFGAWHERDARPELEVVAGAEPRVEARLARGEEADPPLVLAALRLDGEPVDRDRAAVGGDQATDDPEQRRLADAVDAGERRERPRRERERNVVEHPVATAIPALRDSVDDEERRLLEGSGTRIRGRTGRLHRCAHHAPAHAVSSPLGRRRA